VIAAIENAELGVLRRTAGVATALHNGCGIFRRAATPTAWSRKPGSPRARSWRSSAALAGILATVLVYSSSRSSADLLRPLRSARFLPSYSRSSAVMTSLTWRASRPSLTTFAMSSALVLGEIVGKAAPAASARLPTQMKSSPVFR
jgi:hypothetical protein